MKYRNFLIINRCFSIPMKFPRRNEFNVCFVLKKKGGRERRRERREREGTRQCSYDTIRFLFMRVYDVGGELSRCSRVIIIISLVNNVIPAYCATRHDFRERNISVWWRNNFLFEERKIFKDTHTQRVEHFGIFIRRNGRIFIDTHFKFSFDT